MGHLRSSLGGSGITDLEYAYLLAKSVAGFEPKGSGSQIGYSSPSPDVPEASLEVLVHGDAAAPEVVAIPIRAKEPIRLQPSCSAPIDALPL
jgi:hypothetical protein